MRQKKLNALCFLLILGISLAEAEAHPPSLALSYDSDKKILHIDVRHVTTNVRDHHIRKLIIYKNDQEEEVLTYVFQKPSGFEEEVALDAVAGDTIRVKAVCSEAGAKEETFVVP